jgi:hypothetical protein
MPQIKFSVSSITKADRETDKIPEDARFKLSIDNGDLFYLPTIKLVEQVIGDELFLCGLDDKER